MLLKIFRIMATRVYKSYSEALTPCQIPLPDSFFYWFLSVLSFSLCITEKKRIIANKLNYLNKIIAMKHLCCHNQKSVYSAKLEICF